MTKLLLSFVTSRNPDENKLHTAVGKLSGLVGIFCNLLLFAGKLLVGTLAHSVSVTADAMNNLSDAAGSVTTLLGFRLSELPPDEEHPYGHARFEYLSGLAVAAMILLIGVELAKSSVEKILHPSPVDMSVLMGMVLIGSVAVKLWMFFFNRKLARFIDSTALMATAQDSRNDVLSTSAVLLAAIIEWRTGLHIDGFVGLGVAVLILIAGVSLAKDTISPLLGENASPELRQRIIDTVCQEPMVLSYHDLMVHDYGPGQRFATIHVEMDYREESLLCHERIDEIERRCQKETGVHLVVHFDPIVTDNPRLNALIGAIRVELSELDERISAHDFRMVEGRRHTNLIFDVAIPGDISQAEVRAAVNEAVAPFDDSTYHIILNFDPLAFNA